MRNLTATLCLTIIVLLGSIGVSASADFQKGFDAYNRGDYQTALREWRPLAEQGNQTAQYNLGLMYAEGRGVAQSDTEAVKWWRKSAESRFASQGNKYAQAALRAMGIDWTKPQIAEAEPKKVQPTNQTFSDNSQKDFLAAYVSKAPSSTDSEVCKWALAGMNSYLQEARRRGLGCAPKEPKQRSIAADRSFEKGRDAYDRGDHQAALREWRPLAEQGHARAQFSLGRMSRLGIGVPISPAAAVRWYRKAAEQGDALGQLYLGYMYEDGQGVAQSDTEAVKSVEQSVFLLIS